MWVPWQALKFPSPLPRHILAEHVLKIFLFRNIVTSTNFLKILILTHQQISYRRPVKPDNLIWSVVEIKCIFSNGLILYFSKMRTTARWDVTAHSLLTCINVFIGTCWLFLHLETSLNTSVYSQTSVHNVTRIQDVTSLKTVFFIITTGRNSNLIWILIYLRWYLRPNSAQLFMNTLLYFLPLCDKFCLSLYSFYHCQTWHTFRSTYLLLRSVKQPIILSVSTVAYL